MKSLVRCMYRAAGPSLSRVRPATILSRRPCFSARCFLTQRRHTSTTPGGDKLTVLTQSVTDAAAVVRQLQQTVDKRQADVDAVYRYLVSKPAVKPPLPQSADVITQLLWKQDWNMVVLKDAEGKLKDAKSDLKDAKYELHRAEDELHRAEDELKEKLKQQPLSKEELTSFMEEFITHSVQTLSTAVPSTYNITQRIDTGTVQEQLSHLVRSVGSAAWMQDTRAAVLMGASGVGKTFTALTYPTRGYAVAGMAHLTVYLGFSSICCLTEDGEKSFLKKAAEATEHAVATVILGRLIACLAVMEKEGYPERPPNSDVQRIVPGVSCDFLINKLSESNRPRNLDTLSTVLQAKAVELLASLQKIKGKPVAVLINVDEAQEFDVLKKDGAPMGARFALRCLRRLQLDVVTRTNGACVPLGFATGINPYYSLSSATHGFNVIIEGPIMKRCDFDNLALMLKRGTRTETTCLGLSAFYYPRVRALVGCLTGNDYTPMVSDADRDLCVKLFDSFIRGSPLPRDEIPQWCVSWGVKSNDDLRDVYIDYCIWGGLVSRLDPSAPKMVKMPVGDVMPTVERSCFAEDTFARIVYVVLYLMFRPLRGLEAAAADYRRRKGAALQAALGLGAQDCIYILEYDGISFDAKTKFQPFSHAPCHNHDAAYKSGELSYEFKNSISRLTEKNASKGTSVLFACGGSAPIDFIFVRRGDAGELVMWYADSKSHVSKTSKGYHLKEARGVAEKALCVHWGILQACRGIKISPHYTVSVLTNVSLTGEEIKDIEQETQLPVDLSQLKSMKFEDVKKQSINFQTTKAHAPGVKVLCPTNFAFDPLTPVLYRAVDEHAFLQDCARPSD